MKTKFEYSFYIRIKNVIFGFLFKTKKLFLTPRFKKKKNFDKN